MTNNTELLNDPVAERLHSRQPDIKTVSAEDFEFFTKRSNYALSKPGCIDPRIIETVDLINRFPGITTVWSCSGHTREEYLANDPENVYERDKWYVVYVVKEGDNQVALLRKVIKEWQFTWNSRWMMNLGITIEHDECFSGEGLFWMGVQRDRKGSYPCNDIFMRFVNNEKSHAVITKLYEDFNTRLRLATHSFMV